MFLRHPLLASWRVDHGFGTIKGGFRADCITARQVHGVRIDTVVPGRTEPEKFEADGLVSLTEGVEVGVWTADCLPVLMAFREGERVGAFHAGWRGAAAGIVKAGLERLLEEGSGLPGVRIVLGPAIGPCCYDVGPEVWDSVRSRTPSYVPSETRTLDLWDLVTHQLTLAGVPPENIGRISLCTRCHSELFFSHRGWGQERRGRSMLNYIRSLGDGGRNDPG